MKHLSAADKAKVKELQDRLRQFNASALSQTDQEARDKLIQAVQALETGGLNLDQSMRQWEIGEALAKRAQGLLNDVRAKLDQAQAEQAANEATAGTQSNLD